MNEDVIRSVIGRNVFIAQTATVCGEVIIGDDSTIMHHVTIRGDVGPITLGSRVNVQDGSVLHTKTGVPLDIADDVSIGHRAVVHCRRVGRRSLIGTGAIVLDDAEVGEGCIVAAGALVTPGTIVPDGKVVVGMPARATRDVTDADRGYIDHVIQRYLELGRQHAAGRYPSYAG